MFACLCSLNRPHHCLFFFVCCVARDVHMCLLCLWCSAYCGEYHASCLQEFAATPFFSFDAKPWSVSMNGRRPGALALARTTVPRLTVGTRRSLVVDHCLQFGIFVVRSLAFFSLALIVQCLR